MFVKCLSPTEFMFTLNASVIISENVPGLSRPLCLIWKVQNTFSCVWKYKNLRQKPLHVDFTNTIRNKPLSSFLEIAVNYYYCVKYVCKENAKMHETWVEIPDFFNYLLFL